MLDGKVRYSDEYLTKSMHGLSYHNFEDLGQLFETETGLLNMNCVANLPAGVVFGEKGLDGNVRRNATCICNQDTHFGIIYKNDYVKVLKEVSRV